MNFASRKVVIGSIAIFAGVSATPVLAADSDAAGGLEEIVVTARKRGESSQRVPEAVTAITGAQLERSFQSTALGLEGTSPSLVVDKIASAPGAAALSIRGIGFSDAEKSFDPAVGVALDGVFLGTSTGQIFQVFDLERMEVLRGPQGTLFGKNTIGGAISIIRTEPTGVLGGKIKVGAASRDGKNVDGILNLPALADQLAVKLVYTQREQEGPDRNIAKNNRRVGGTDYESYGATLKWTPTDKLKVIYTFQKEKDNSPIPGLTNNSLSTDLFCFAPSLVFGPGAQPTCSLDGQGRVPMTGDVHTVNQNGPDDMYMYLDGHTLSASWQVSDSSSINYLYGYRQSEESIRQDFDASPNNYYQTWRPQDFEQQSHELRWNFDPGHRFNLVTGFYYWDANYQMDQRTWFGIPVTAAPNVRQRVDHSTESWAVFAQSHINITDEWILTVGGRYTSERKEFEIDNLDPLAPPGSPHSTFGTPAKETWSKFTPKAGIRWQFTPEQMTYVSYSTGFRSGGFNGRAGTYVGATTPYDPETVNTIELGYKSEWLQDRLRLNADVFYSKYKDKQEDIVAPAPFSSTGQETLTTNAAVAKFKGLEVELTAVPLTGWTVRAAAAFLDAKYDSFCASSLYDTFDPVPSCGPGLSDYSSLELRRAPKQTFSADSTNVIPVGPGELIFNIAGRYKSKYYTTVQNIPLGLAKGAAKFDASLGYDWNGWSVSGYVHNFTNKKVLNSALNVASLWSFNTYTDPREYGVELMYKFGSK